MRVDLSAGMNIASQWRFRAPLPRDVVRRIDRGDLKEED
jgi:hypothetical protein